MKNYKSAVLLCLITAQGQANVIQYFTGISYSNPAELFKIKKNDLIIGGTGFNTNGRFNGSALNLNTNQYDVGQSQSKTSSFLPYGRIAQRFNDRLVFALDLTEPFHSNLDWGNDSITRYSATQTKLRDIDISPKLGLSLTQQLHIGAGLNFNFLDNNEGNWAMPTGPNTYANLVNESSSFALGYNAGVYYVINPMNFVGVTYYGRMKQHSVGTSTLGALQNTELSFNFNMPATTLLNYVHIFNEKWLMSTQVIRSEWNANQYATFKNTAGTYTQFSFPMKFKPSYAFSGAVRRQMTQKLGLTGIGVIDNGPEQDRLRTLNFPADRQFFLALAADYRTSEHTSIELLYGHGFSRTNMNNQISLNNGVSYQPFTTGPVKIDANVLSLKFEMQFDDPKKAKAK